MTARADNRPLRTLLRNLVLLLGVVYLAVVAWLWRDTLADTRNDLAYTESMLAQAVRTTLRGHELILRGLGTELIARGALANPEAGRALIERMKKLDPGMVGFGLARPDGQLILVSGVPRGQPLPNLMHRAETERSFRQALASEHLRTGRPNFFKELNAWVVPIRVAIRDATGQVEAVMNAGYSLEHATTAWSNVTLLPEVTVALVGDDGYLRYVHPTLLGERGDVHKDYLQPVDLGIRKEIDSLGPELSFLGIVLPKLGGFYYLVHSRISTYDLDGGAFIPRSAVVGKWLHRLLAPSGLIAIFLLGGGLAYGRASRQQAQSDAEIGRLSAWQQAVLDGADYSIIATDKRGAVVSFNRAAQEMLGYRAEEVMGKAVVLIHDPAEVEARAAELSRQFAMKVPAGFEAVVAKARDGGNEECEWTYVRKDGSRLPVRLSVTPLTARDGQRIGFLEIAADLSEHKSIRADLRDSEARYRILFENAGDAIFLMREGRFIDCNPAALDMFGCTREQIIGATPSQYSPATQPDGEPSADKARKKTEAVLAGQAQFFEWRHVRQSGATFDAEVTQNVVEIGGLPHVLVTVRDISARKRSEAELRMSRQALIERNESLDLINRLSQSLHGVLWLDSILNETIQALLGLSRTPHVAIYLVEPGEQRLKLAASYGFPEDLKAAGETLPMSDSLTGLALSQGVPFEMTDIDNEDRLFPPVKAALLKNGAKSGIVIPLFFQNRPLGSINLIYQDQHYFDEMEVETLVSLSNTVALAIANARHVENLAFHARHDSLTGLPNRLMLHEGFEQYIAGGQGKAQQAALMLLDLDRFKEVNDTLGHHVGDQMLIRVSERLSRLCRPSNALVARLGGDEFAVLLHAAHPNGRAVALAERMIEELHRPFQVEGLEMSLGASIGVAYFPEDGTDSHSLLRAADVAMYHAKTRSAGVTVYDKAFDDYSTERLALAHELVQAIQQQQLVLHYQPKIEIGTGAVTGLEALVRWQHPRLGLLEPRAFIHLAEMGEVIHPFTRAVLELAVSDKRHLHDLGHRQPVAVNLSAMNLTDARCLTFLKAALTAHELEAGQIELELTETALMHDPDNALSLLKQFDDMGVSIAVDDFGTGYSSLSYLRRLPIKALKIDQSFVKDMRMNQQDSTIVRSTIALAHNLDLKVIAEGVEDDETLSALQGMGCDQAQGYGICRPQPMEQITAWLERR